MNDEIYILDRPTVKIMLNKQLELFTVDLLSNDGYNEEGFNEFLAYFKNTWKTIQSGDDIFALYINIKESRDAEIPLQAYMSLLKCINDINDILRTRCHCICIFTNDANKWQGVYDFMTKLWNPRENRPIKFTDDQDDKTLFLQSNKLIR